MWLNCTYCSVLVERVVFETDAVYLVDWLTQHTHLHDVGEKSVINGNANCKKFTS